MVEDMNLSRNLSGNLNGNLMLAALGTDACHLRRGYRIAELQKDMGVSIKCWIGIHLLYVGKLGTEQPPPVLVLQQTECMALGLL